MDHFLGNSISSVVTSNRILYTASHFAKTSLLYLQEIGELEAKRAHTSSRSHLQSFLFFMVEAGAGSLVYGEKTYQLRVGDCVFINCADSYSHMTDPDNLWALRWIHFYGPTVSQIYDKYKERGGRPVFHPNDSTGLCEEWEDLFEIANSSDYMRDMLINQHLSALLTLIMSESWHPEDQALAKKKASVMEVKEYVDKHYSEKLALDDLAALFYINKYYLIKVFKEQFGQSLSSYLLSVRITKAKQLLRFSNKTVEQIGYECGLGAPHYFSQTFKKVEGVPPSIYRKQW